MRQTGRTWICDRVCATKRELLSRFATRYDMILMEWCTWRTWPPKTIFWSRKTIFLLLGAKHSSHAGLVTHSHAMHSRTLVFLHDVILCPDASVIFQRKSQTVNWLLCPGQRSRRGVSSSGNLSSSQLSPFFAWALVCQSECGEL